MSRSCSVLILIASFLVPGVCFCRESPYHYMQNQFDNLGFRIDRSDVKLSVQEQHEPGFSTTSQEINFSQRKFIANGLVGAGFLGYLIYGYYVFWQDVEYHTFTVSDWNDTHQRTYAGGSDKIAHAFGGYIITRTSSQLYRWAGSSRKKAAWLGFTISQTFLLFGEIEDGFTIVYGFDPVDLVSNIVGGLIGVGEELSPTFDNMFDFRLDYWPSREFRERENFTNVAEDYSGLRFFLVYKFSGLGQEHVLRDLRFLEFYVGFGTEGYYPAYDRISETEQEGFDPYDRCRNMYIGFSFNLRELLDVFVYDDPAHDGIFRSITDFILEYYHHPLRVDQSIEISTERAYYSD